MNGFNTIKSNQKLRSTITGTLYNNSNYNRDSLGEEH